MKLSIRKFLLLNLLLAIMATTSIAALGNYYLDQQDIQNNLDSLLGQAAISLQTLVSSDVQKRDLNRVQQDLNTIPTLVKGFLAEGKLNYLQPLYTKSYAFQVWKSDGKLLLHSASAPIYPISDFKVGFSDKIIDGEPWRVATVHGAQNGLTYMVAEHYNVRNRLAHVIMKDDAYIMLLTYPLSAILIWIIIGRGLSSLRHVADEVSQRAADHLDPVDLEAVPIEVKPLVDELNTLFLRLKQAFEREQRFSADAAHELRTPLAALKTQAQVALKTMDPKERRVQLQNLIAGVDRCTHVIQQLLTLCRMSPESVTLEDPVPVDLHKIAAEVVAQLAPSAIDKQIEIELNIEGEDCTIMGNATGLHALFRNLVDNAIRYTPPGGAIKVFIESDPQQIIIRVVDNGPGIPADLRSRVFERFFRVLGTKAQGSGLGLAIVQQIVKLHQGIVVLGAPFSGVGLEVTVNLPKTPSHSFLHHPE